MGVKMCVDEKVITMNKTPNEVVNDNPNNVIDNFTYEEFECDKDDDKTLPNPNVGPAVNEENNVNNVVANENISNHSSKDKPENVFLNQEMNGNSKEEEKKEEVEHKEVANNEDKIEDFRAPTKSKSPNPQLDATANAKKNEEDDLEKIESVSHRNNQTSHNEEKENTVEMVDTVSKKHIKSPVKNIFPNIFSIIPQKLLMNCDSSELLFLSELKKMININAKERVKYSDRFCMVTKENFIIYNSKENYITLKRPLAILPINQISRVVLFKLNPKARGYDHFYICFEKNKNTELIFSQINTFFMNAMTEDENENKENGINENEALIMFKSESSDLIKKWYVVLEYLINLSKNEQENNEENKETNHNEQS